MIIEDPRRGITEMDRVNWLTSRWGQLQGADVVDGHAVVRAIVKELESAGGRMPESTKLVMRSAAASVLRLMEKQK